MDAKCRKNDCTTPPIVSKTEDRFVAEKYFFESFLKKSGELWGGVEEKYYLCTRKRLK
jgi:hypothetical protein